MLNKRFTIKLTILHYPEIGYASILFQSEGTEGYSHKQYVEQNLNNVASWFRFYQKHYMLHAFACMCARRVLSSL